MKTLQIILYFFITISVCAQSQYDGKKISSKTKKIVKKIEKINELMSSAVYASGTKPKQWDNFEQLRKVSDKNELIELTNHPNGVVRSYSFWALSYNKEVDLFSIVKNHLNDYELINTQFGCTGGQEMVGDFFIQLLTPQYIDLDSDKMNTKKMRELDSLLIYQPNKLSSRNHAINRAEPVERLYPKIRELVIKEKNKNALVTLAKYKKEQDIEIIKNFKDETDGVEDGFYYTYVAIQHFPRQEYFPLLEGNLEKTLDDTHFSTEWGDLYKAIASFKNQKALELLEIPFTKVQDQNIKKYHINFVFYAILEFQTELYDNLLWKIWEEENQKTLHSYKYLLSLNSSKAYELTKRELIEDYKIQESNFIPNFKDVEESENFYEYLLNVVIVNDRDLSNKIIKEQIEKADVHNLPLYTSKVNQQIMFVEPLFNRLETAWNAHIYLNIIKTLIEFNDKDINKRIVEMRKKNNNLNENWGGEALDDLLSVNGIK